MVFRVERLQTGKNDDLAARLWTDGPSIRGVVIVVHGLGAHGDRFSALAVGLTKNGWAVMAFDLPGHGLSASMHPENRQGEVGRFDDVLLHLAAQASSETIHICGLVDGLSDALDPHPPPNRFINVDARSRRSQSNS